MTHAMKPQTETELLLPPLRTTATIITMLSAAFLIVIVVSHQMRSQSQPQIVLHPAAAPAERPVEPAPVAPYGDARTIGLY